MESFLLTKIKAKMEELNWTVSELARATGISKQNLSPILAGKRPLKVNHLFVLDTVLNLDIDYARIGFTS